MACVSLWQLRTAAPKPSRTRGHPDVAVARPVRRGLDRGAGALARDQEVFTILIGIPKGRLLDRFRHELEACGFAPDSDRRYTQYSPEGQTCKYVKPQDLPWLIAAGHLHLGLACEEWILEHGVHVAKLARFVNYQVTIAALVSGSTMPHPSGVRPLYERLSRPIRVATCYPNLASEYMGAHSTPFAVLAVVGSCEAYVPELADIAVDCVETGQTARENNLCILDRLARCTMFLSANDRYLEDHGAEVHKLVSFIIGRSDSIRAT